MPTDQFGNRILTEDPPPSPFAQSLLENRGRGRSAQVVLSGWKHYATSRGQLTDEALHLMAEMRNLAPGWNVRFNPAFLDGKNIVTAWLEPDQRAAPSADSAIQTPGSPIKGKCGMRYDIPLDNGGTRTRYCGFLPNHPGPHSWERGFPEPA